MSSKASHIDITANKTEIFISGALPSNTGVKNMLHEYTSKKKIKNLESDMKNNTE